jgi:DNA-binding NarL/FixJ family response regulator
MPIDIVLVDDHAVVRDGLRVLLELEPDFRVAAAFGDAAEAVRFCTESNPDVALLDVAMPGLGGIEAARQIHDLCADTRILMLSMHAGTEYVHQALRAGADGYVLKESAGAEVVEAVRTVNARQRFLSRKISPQALDEYSRQRSRSQDPLARLSARERQVLKLVVEGSTSNEIAAMIGVSPKSVETYRSRLMFKLEIHDLTALVKFAIRHGVTSEH